MLLVLKKKTKKKIKGSSSSEGFAPSVSGLLFLPHVVIIVHDGREDV
jgi:hypothetical protein